MIRHLYTFILILLLTGCATSAGSTSSDNSPSTITLLSETPVIFFRKYISSADGDRCDMTPTCSRYALDAIDRHGPVMGWIMAFDRILRCGRDELQFRPPVVIHGRNYCPDTVSDNDFWWSTPQ